MMANHRRNKKYRKGFTLTEVLVTVVILAITVSLAAPAVIGGVRRLNLNRLDDSARAIFLASQNSLTAMVGNGELDKFAEGVTGNEVMNLLPPGADAPSDFPKKSGGDPDMSHGNPEDLRYLDSMGSDAQKAALKKLLPGGSIDKELEKHHYVVEYNYKTGAVYAVWYSDKEEFAKEDAYTGEPRTYDERLKGNTLIGYYGGSGVDYAAVGQMPIPELTLTNAEELRLHIKMPACSFDPGDIGLEVVIKGKTSGVSKTIIARGSSVLLNKDKEADIMLDTLKAASLLNEYQNIPTGNWTARKPFKEWIKETDPSKEKLIPGEDISVTVTTYYAGSADDALYLPQGATVKCNSLFASVEDTSTDPVNPIPTAMIAYGRHLQNLDAFIATGDASGQIGTDGTNGNAITAAEQIRKIDFTAVNGTKDAVGGAFTPGNGSKDIYYWANTYGTVNKTTGEITDPKPFIAIYNSALKSYDGSSLPIRNMDAEAQAVGGNACAGLFASIAGTAADHAQLKDITLIDTKATAENAAGALAGRAEYADFENCQVYLENRENIKPTGTGAGTDAEPVKMIQAGTYAGGMVGLAENSHFSYCFASTGVGINENVIPQVVNSRVGGLIGVLNGSASDSRVDKCYAAGYLTGTRLVGGLVGFSDQGSVVNSYAAGVIAEVTGTLYSGGIKTGLAAGLGCVDNDNTKNCYAAVRFGEKVMKAALQESTEDGFVTVYGAKRKKTGHTIDTSVYFIPQAGVKYAEASGTKVTSTQLSEMEASQLGTGGHIANDIWYQLPAEINDTTNPTYATFPYRQTDETATLDTPYPYPMLKTTDAAGNDIPMFHYGDWLEETEVNWCYYEDYGTMVAPRYGVWGYRNDGVSTEPIHSLMAGSSGVTAVADGYGFLVLQDANGKSQCPGDIAVTGGTLKPLPEDPADTNSQPKMIENAYSYRDTTTRETYVYDLYPYTFEDGTTATPAAQYYQSVYLFNQEYWFNCDYACEAVQAPAGGDITRPQIKPHAAGFASSIVDADQYNNKVVIRTARQLANMARATGSTKDVTKPAQMRTYEQLMEINYDTYKGVDGNFNIGTAARPQTPAALHKIDGGSTGSYNGHGFSISNLHIGSTSSYVGLFGELGTSSSGTIQNIRLVDVTVDGENHDYVGALAGNVTNSTPIENCGVYVSNATKYDDCSVTGDTNVGGLFGMLGSNTTVKGSFAAVKVNGTDVVGGFVGQINGTRGLEDCYSGGHTEGGKYVSGSVNVTATSGSAGGFAGKLEGRDTSTADSYKNFKDILYSTCSVSGNTDETGKFAGEISDNPSGTREQIVNALKGSGATIYAVGEAFDRITGNSATLRDETAYLGSSGTNGQTVFNTYPYDDALFNNDPLTGKTAKKYPFQTNLTAHYGDWVENSLEACFYWEKEGTDYRVYVVGFTTSMINTLCPTHHKIDDVTGGTNATSNSNTDWGYGTIGLTDSLIGTGVGKIDNTNPTAAAVITALKAQGLSFEGADVEVYTGATADASMTVHSVADSSKTYHLNLGFAAAISLNNDLGGTGNPYKIRNVQQLDNIPDSSSSSFQQTHDMYGDGYSGYSGASNFTGTSSLAGTYDGQSYRILELNMTSGLFTSISGYANLDNIILYSPSGAATVSGSSAPAGGLAGKVEGYCDIYINNCVVAGYKMSNTSQHLGGLVGEVGFQTTDWKLYIKNSEAVDKLAYTGDSAHSAGGLVGHADTGTVDITNSYAGGEISGNSYFGGIVGNANGTKGAVIYTNVYSYMKIISSVKYGIGPVGSVYFGARYQNCHYWSDGLSGLAKDASASGVTQATWEQLKSCISNNHTDADRTYWPANSTHTTGDSYPFPAVVQGYPDDTDGSPASSKQYVHYGDWPTP